MIDPRTKDVCAVARILTSGLKGAQRDALVRKLGVECEAHRAAWLEMAGAKCRTTASVVPYTVHSA